MQFLLPAPQAKAKPTPPWPIALQPLTVVSHFMRTTHFGALEYVSALIPHHACQLMGSETTVVTFRSNRDLRAEIILPAPLERAANRP
jgi:hypothetical protein